MGKQIVVHHYPAGNQFKPTVEAVPPGTRILSAAMNGGSPVVYVEKDIYATGSMQYLHAVYIGTGHTFEPGDLEFIGTVQDGPFFWHVYGKIV